MAEDAYKKAFERERLARKEAERITESKSRELWTLNQALKDLNVDLERRIQERTNELEVARNRAEANTQAKSEFLSVMSHEMRSPLNVIVGLTELLSQEDLEEPNGGYVRNMRFSALQLLNLINDILDLSAIEAGKIVVEETPFDLKNSVDKVFQALEHRAVDKGLTWSHEMDLSLPSPLLGDPAKLNQILINLLDNAIKFTREGGVHLTMSRMSKEEEGKVWVVFEVRDTGKGISSENLNRIFQKFEQENQSIRRVHGGSGLGLSISQQLVELQGGLLDCESEEGSGTTFRVELPFTYEARAEEKQVSEAKEADLTGFRVLVAEDLEVNRMLVRQMLRRTGAEILESSDGKETLQVLAAQPVDLILMDLHMPEMDGIEATECIRAGEISRVSSDIPIVCLTADVFKETRDNIFAAGMNDFLTKPVDMQRLIHTLHHWKNRLEERKGQ
jgi:signal transduction histidine kinase/ActR/RegA family two-component response regulator